MMLVVSMTALAGCQQEKSTLQSQSVTEQDMQEFGDRKQQHQRFVYVMAKQIPLFDGIPTEYGGQSPLFVHQGDKLRIIDELRVQDSSGRDYLYVLETGTNTKGYVYADYLVDTSFTMGITIQHATHYFQPNEILGTSNTLFLPAYTVIFSQQSVGNDAFVTYQAIDLDGYPLSGYLKREHVSFDPTIMEAYRLYNQAFHADSFIEQEKLVQRLVDKYSNTFFSILGTALIDIRNFTTLGSDVVLFNRQYYAFRRREQPKKGLIPIYSSPHEGSHILGYIADEQPLVTVAAFQYNENLTDVQLPYTWYLVDRRGWVQADYLVSDEYPVLAEDALLPIILEEMSIIGEVIEDEGEE
ncbi:hypothetical protein PVA44_04805 [Entomospira nematocerorum]|uniref:SH3 domain-containing protein n=1 Tax=Entomospira nematocerorum TaxID=2719987 RepID=A0A968GE74_9SPIO|nr:hypothetical protein [Entomospira nematocera]NIZ46660.1 hypothetical protein [Entomospira nematocera]WDI33543.1 hypothetical protein PVA44_04805 [Entomospira nematocera]